MVIVSSILNYLRQERIYRATRTQLHAMDDHLLADIGIRRDQINSLVAEQREIKRKLAATETKKQRTSRPAISRRGLASQH